VVRQLDVDLSHKPCLQLLEAVKLGAVVGGYRLDAVRFSGEDLDERCQKGNCGCVQAD
jgi:hypothetical protein